LSRLLNLSFFRSTGPPQASSSRLPTCCPFLPRKSDRSNRFWRENFAAEDLQSSQGGQERRRTEEGVDRGLEAFQPVPDRSRVSPGRDLSLMIQTHLISMNDLDFFGLLAFVSWTLGGLW